MSARCRQPVPHLAHVAHPPARSASRRTATGALLALVAALGAGPAVAQSIDALPVAQALELTRSQAGVPAGARVEVLPGRLDPRLKLAPCARIEPYLPPGVRPWGRIRVGLRCVDGPVAWNVYLPVTVRVWARAVVSAGALAAHTPLEAADLRLAEVDLAERPSPAYTDPQELVGRRLARAVAPGTALRADFVQARQWFGAGDTVRVISQGTGFSVSGEAQALTPGLEGQPVRLRTESGRILSAWPVGERAAEVRM